MTVVVDSVAVEVCVVGVPDCVDSCDATVLAKPVAVAMAVFEPVASLEVLLLLMLAATPPPTAAATTTTTATAHIIQNIHLDRPHIFRRR